MRCSFGSLLLLGGRLGDIFGRRRVFIAGIAVFSVGSLLGGFATTQWWLLSARVLQGSGAALAAPTALALIATTFPMGPPRTRALGVYAAMSGAGGAIGLLLGGILTTYVSWRWVLFVNVPIGIAVLVLAPHRPGVVGPAQERVSTYPASSPARRGWRCWSTASRTRPPGSDGVSHWGRLAAVASLAAAVMLLVSFVRDRAAQQPSRAAAAPAASRRRRARTSSRCCSARRCSPCSSS